MSDGTTPQIRVIKPADVVWSEAARNPEETDPPGSEFTAATSPDGKFSVGFWQRDVQRRHFVRPYHEVALILEGEVEIELDDGTVLHAGPGDILDTPKGSSGYWRSLTPARKLRSIYEDGRFAPETSLVTRDLPSGADQLRNDVGAPRGPPLRLLDPVGAGHHPQREVDADPTQGFRLPERRLVVHPGQPRERCVLAAD